MTIGTAKVLRSCLEDMGIACDVREGYSGRGMYGKETCGIVVPCIAKLFAAIAMAASDLATNSDPMLEQFIKDMKYAQTDSMGREMIVY